MNSNQYNKLKGKKPEAGTFSAITFALSESYRSSARKRKHKTKGAFGKPKIVRKP